MANAVRVPRARTRILTALQLRYLQTLLEIGGSNSSTIIFPAPIDLIKPFLVRVPEPRTISPSAEHERRQAA